MRRRLKALKYLSIERKSKIISTLILPICYLLTLTIVWASCKKQDTFTENSINPISSRNEFLQHKNTLSRSTNYVLNNIRLKMSDKQINEFVKKAGFIIWDKAKVYAKPSLRNLAARHQGEADSIVVLPVALPNADNVNAALVAQIYNSGDSIIYSTHFKNHFKAIDSTLLPGYNLTARELYVLGIAQLDAEIFNHKRFTISDESLKFGQQVNANRGNSSYAFIDVIVPSMCEYNFTYSSAVVFPPVTIWTYTASCGSPVLSPPIAFLQDLDESYGFVSYSSVPVGEEGGGTTSPYSLEFSTFYNSLNTIQQAFLDNQEYNEYYHGFIDYLILHQFSQQAKDKIVWSINYLTSPTTLITTFSEFASTYLNDFPSLSFLSQDDINWLNNYPYLKSRIFYYLENNMILNAEQKVQFHINKMRTESSYFTFNTAYSTYSQYKDLWFNDYSYLYKLGGNIFGDWAINYLMQHPNVKIETFQNQFMRISEGEDGEYDSNYWDNPNLSFPPQDLPTWITFKSNYPRHDNPLYNEPVELYTAIGGQVLTAYNSDPPKYQNTCALRISKALNYSGIIIPAGTNRYQGADGRYYFLSAAALLKWMKITFGTPTGSNHLTGPQGGTNGENFTNLLSNKKGIYIMTPNYPGGCDTPISTGIGFCASGHADIIENADCDGGCFFNARGGVNEIFIWELQ